MTELYAGWFIAGMLTGATIFGFCIDWAARRAWKQRKSDSAGGLEER